MTKDQALQAMNAGEKVRHRFMEKDEWITINQEREIQAEDGYTCSVAEFFSIRTSRFWQDGWEIFKSKN